MVYEPCDATKLIGKNWFEELQLQCTGMTLSASELTTQYHRLLLDHDS